MPVTKQIVAVIGAENDAVSTFAKEISGGNYRVLLIGKDVPHLESVVRSIEQSNAAADVCVMECQHDACWEADIIIMAIPCNNQKEAAKLIADVATQKIVVYIENKEQQANIEELQNILPYSKMVGISGVQESDIYISGRNMAALQTVSELINTAGFNPIIKEQLVKSAV